MAFGKAGLKTWAFYRNLLEPNSSEEVTLDRHMVRYFRDLGFSGYLTRRRYQELEGVIQEAAYELGVIPCQLQAAIWLAVKEGRL
jgi:thermostable 8-oxoguanine DNA glycosylase